MGNLRIICHLLNKIRRDAVHVAVHYTDKFDPVYRGKSLKQFCKTSLFIKFYTVIGCILGSKNDLLYAL